MEAQNQAEIELRLDSKAALQTSDLRSRFCRRDSRSVVKQIDLSNMFFLKNIYIYIDIYIEDWKKLGQMNRKWDTWSNPHEFRTEVTCGA